MFVKEPLVINYLNIACTATYNVNRMKNVCVSFGLSILLERLGLLDLCATQRLKQLFSLSHE